MKTNAMSRRAPSLKPVASEDGLYLQEGDIVQRQGWLGLQRRKRVKHYHMRLVTTPGDDFFLVAMDSDRPAAKIKTLLQLRRCTFTDTAHNMVKKSDAHGMRLSIRTKTDFWQLLADSSRDQEGWFNEILYLLEGTVKPLKSGYLMTSRGLGSQHRDVMFRLLPKDQGDQYACLASFHSALDEVPRARFYLGPFAHQDRIVLRRLIQEHKKDLSVCPSASSVFEFGIHLFAESKKAGNTILNEQELLFKTTSREEMTSWIRALLDAAEEERDRGLLFDSDDSDRHNSRGASATSTLRSTRLLSPPPPAHKRRRDPRADDKEAGTRPRKQSIAAASAATDDASSVSSVLPPPAHSPPRSPNRSQGGGAHSSDAHARDVPDNLTPKKGHHHGGGGQKLPADIKAWDEDQVLGWAREQPRLPGSVVRVLETQEVDGWKLLGYTDSEMKQDGLRSRRDRESLSLTIQELRLSVHGRPSA